MSLLVTGSLAVYLAAPEGYALTMSRSVASIRGSAIVFYGKVDTYRGSPLSGVRVQVTSNRVVHPQRGDDRDRDDHGRGHRPPPFDKVTYTAANGTYRIDPPAGRYRLTITDRLGDREVSSSTVIDAVPGHAYDVSATARSDGSVFFAPISGY